MKRILLLMLVMASATFACPAQEADSTVFIPKGEWTLGGQLGYGNLGNENSELFLIVNPINLKGSAFIIAPFFSWTYSDDRSIGLRASWFIGEMNVDNVTLDLLNEGLSFSLTDIKGNARSLGASVYHRNYFKLDKKGRFGVICEFSLGYTNTRMEFKNDTGSWTNTSKVKLSFSPGIMVYLMKNVSLDLTVGMADVFYNHADCYRNGAKSGSRDKAGARMGLDLTGIKLCVAFHL